VTACDRSGGQGAWAAENGMSAAYVSDVLAGRRQPGKKMLAALRVQRVVTYRKVLPDA